MLVPRENDVDSAREVNGLQLEAHGVGLSDGAPFGSPPGRHLRLNFGCPRATLEEALRRMRAAVAAA